MEFVIISDDDSEEEPKQKSKVINSKCVKTTIELNDEYKEEAEDSDTKKPIKRIKPTKISDIVTCSKSKIDKEENEKNSLNIEFTNLLKACRNADSSNDMELLIEKKLLRYYETVHPDFVNSKSFCKTVQSVTNDINSNPGLVYLKVTGIIDELKIRRKSKNIVVTNEELKSGTGCEIKDRQIKRLNKALYYLKRRIAELEESEVDFEENENSTYLQEQRYKRRACEIYEKICDITGESKHAHRSTRKPIQFRGTIYPEFNKAIQRFVNQTNTFPDYFDVIKCLQYCNKQYDFKLTNDDMKKIAQDAFIKIGKLLQNRRRADLYETVSYFVGTKKDPATEDPSLLGKLSENKKFHSRITDIIDKFANEQDIVKINKETAAEEILNENSNQSISNDLESNNSVEVPTTLNIKDTLIVKEEIPIEILDDDI